ncbi:hypothetical protein [Morganella morganii]|uniref:hypothetical protein n=1 Tax=Morganella morganii TaxID=582 RepID=UPI001BDB6DB8|nr:hypothetical protein [Morganella morganii]MBT0460100.1 hypothetical protein [Morganella morganii subsp. morganii]
MKYLKSLPAPLFIIATVLISSGCSQKNYDVDAGEKIIYPSGDGVLLGACDKWTLKDEQVRQLIAMSKPYIALPYGEYSQTPCNMSGTVTIDGKTWDYLLNGGGIITLSIDGMVRYRGCNADACKPYLLLPYRGKSFAIKDSDTLVTEEESTENRGRLLSRESVAQRQPHSDPGMVSGAPSDGTMVNKETGAEQFRPDNGRMRRPDAQPVAGGQSGQTAPQGQQSTPVSSDRNGKVPPARPQAENSRMSSVKKEVASAAESAMPSVNIDAPSITAPEVGISVPGTSAPTLDIKAPAVSLPGAEVSVPALKNPF